MLPLPGADYGLAVGDNDVVIDEVEELLTGSRPTHATDRVLARVMFTDIVDSTPRAARWVTPGGVSCSRHMTS